MVKRNLVPKNWFDINLEDKFKLPNIITQLQKDFDDLLYKSFQGQSLLAKVNDFLPETDFSEDKNSYNISMEIPGIDPKNVEISLRDNQLEIKGEKKEEKEQKDKNYFYSERSYGNFYRTFSIPSDADPDKIEAKFNNGVVNIILPKNESKQKSIKKIEIKS